MMTPDVRPWTISVINDVIWNIFRVKAMIPRTGWNDISTTAADRFKPATFCEIISTKPQTFRLCIHPAYQRDCFGCQNLGSLRCKRCSLEVVEY